MSAPPGGAQVDDGLGEVHAAPDQAGDDGPLSPAEQRGGEQREDGQHGAGCQEVDAADDGREGEEVSADGENDVGQDGGRADEELDRDRAGEADDELGDIDAADVTARGFGVAPGGAGGSGADRGVPGAEQAGGDRESGQQP